MQVDSLAGDSLAAPEWVRCPRRQKSLGIEDRNTKVVIWGICDAWNLSDLAGGGVTLQSAASTGGRREQVGVGSDPGRAEERELCWEGGAGGQEGRRWLHWSLGHRTWGRVQRFLP